MGQLLIQEVKGWRDARLAHDRGNSPGSPAATPDEAQMSAGGAHAEIELPQECLVLFKARLLRYHGLGAVIMRLIREALLVASAIDEQCLVRVLQSERRLDDLD